MKHEVIEQSGLPDRILDAIKNRRPNATAP